MRISRTIPIALISALLFLGSAGSGQDKEVPKKESAGGQVRRVIPLKYADPQRVRDLVGNFGGDIRADREMRVLTVVGSPGDVGAVEDAVKKLDVPPPSKKDIEITAYFLLAKRDSSQSGSLPPALGDVVNELKKVLNYQSFTLLNTSLIRTRDGDGSTVKGVAGEGDQTAAFSLGFQHVNLMAEEKGPTLQLANLDFRLMRQGPWTSKDSHGGSVVSTDAEPLALIHTNIDVPVGQKVVVGKTSYLSADNALILVLTGKVMD